jgi:hypothetical protein
METGRIKDAPATENLTENQKAKIKTAEPGLIMGQLREKSSHAFTPILRTSA